MRDGQWLRLCEGEADQSKQQSKHKMDTLMTSHLANEELTAAAERILPVLGGLYGGDPVLLAIVKASEGDVAWIHQAAGRELGSDLTDPIQLADETRDNAFTTLRDFAGIWAKNGAANAAQREAGGRLRAVFAKHGNSLHRTGYTVESGLMGALLADLGSESSRRDLETLGLTASCQRLVAAQAEFERLWGQKFARPAEAGAPPLRESVPALKRRLNLLVDVAAEVERLNPSTETSELLAKLNEIIKDLTAPVQARQTREAKEAEAEAKAAGAN